MKGATGLGGCCGYGYLCIDGLVCQTSQPAFLKVSLGLGGCYDTEFTFFNALHGNVVFFTIATLLGLSVIKPEFPYVGRGPSTVSTDNSSTGLVTAARAKVKTGLVVYLAKLD